jgi:hypothetical protein
MVLLQLLLCMASGWCFLFIACCFISLLDAAAAANYRDALLRNSSGTYNIKGTESYHCAVPPTVFK